MPGCSAPVKDYECVLLPVEPAPDPHALWDCHRDIVRRALRGKKFTLREFREAADFFESLTAIPAAATATPHGLVPTKDLKQSLTAWDEWYATHGSRLYWDPQNDRIRTR